MRWSCLLFAGLAVSSMSFSVVDRDQDLVDDGKTGWELKPALPDAKPVNTKERFRGLYPAGSRLKDEKALGGFGPCNNFPFDLGEKDWGVKGKVALIAFPQEKVAYFKYEGIALRVINRSDKVAAFAAFDSMMYIIQEAQDEKGRWREIELAPDIHAFCGNSFHRVLLAPGQYWQFPARQYEGTFKTKIRFRLDPTRQPGEEPPVYSNEFDGRINPNQLRVGPDRAALGKAFHSTKATPDGVATLIEALSDDDKGTRCLAASHLGRFGAEAKDAVPALWTALKSSDGTVRAEAAAALFRIDNQPKAAIDVLSDLVQGRDLEARRRALWALHDIGPAAKDAVPALCKAILKEPDQTLRYNFAEALGKIRSRPDLAVPALQKTLTDSEWIVRSYAAHALGEFGADAKSAIPALTNALKDPDGHIRVSAALALWQVSDKTEPSLGVLIACLKIPKEHDYVPDAAAGALGKMGPAAKDAIPALNDLLADKHAWRGSRIAAAGALWRVARDSKAAMPVFLKELQDPMLSPNESDTSRMFAVLEDMGPHAKEAIPRLRKLVEQGSPELREAAAKLLTKIEP
jgi:HEAT repeat protein